MLLTIYILTGSGGPWQSGKAASRRKWRRPEWERESHSARDVQCECLFWFLLQVYYAC